MKKKFRIFVFVYIGLYIAACVMGATLPAQGNTYMSGATIYFPKDNSIVSDDFSVNGSVYALKGVKSVRLIIENKKEIGEFDIKREEISYNGENLLTLSTFKDQIEFMNNGTYKMHIELKDLSGTFYVFPSKIITVDSEAPDTSFKMFGAQHIIPLLILSIIFALIFILYKNKEKAHMTFAYICSLLIMTGDIASRIWLISNGTFRASYDMALHMCDISGVMIPLFLFMKPGKLRDKMYNLFFLWGLGGALMALLTPEMGGYAFPSYYYFNFFIKHSMIIFGVLIATVFFGMRPNIKYLGWVMAVSLVIVAAIYGINQLVALIPPYEPGNYMFLSYPPTGGSLIDMMVDIFGPSPYYIIGLVITGAVIYVALWLPFYVGSKISKMSFINERRVYEEN